jgi:hypothetical protein
MKLYINVGPTEIGLIQKFAQDKDLLCDHENIFDFFGIFCIDTVERSISTGGVPGDLPKSFIIDWDLKKVDDLFENRVLARFNEGKPQWTLMDSDAMLPMINVLGYGCLKYDRDNWKKACPKRLSLMDSLQRHALKIIAGESIDPESGLPHIGHLMCNAMFYSYWEQKTNGQFENFVSL